MRRYYKFLLLGVLILTIASSLMLYRMVTNSGSDYNYQGVYVGHLKKRKVDLSKKEWNKKDFEFLYEEIKNNYVNLPYKEELLNIDWDGLYALYSQQLEDIKTDEEFELLCRKFLYTLKDGHTYFRSIDPKQGTYNTSMRYVMWGQLVEGKYIIVSAQRELDVLGYEILSVNGLDIKEIVGTMTKYYPKGHNPLVERNDILNKGKFWEYFKYFNDTYPEELTLVTKDLEGKEKTIIIDTSKRYPRNNMEAIPNINFGMEQDTLPTYELLDHQIAYIDIPTFNLDRKETVDQFHSIVNKLKEETVKGVIIDIRYNSGGNSSFKDILGYLTEQPIDIAYYRMKKGERYKGIYAKRPIEKGDKETQKPEKGYTEWGTWTVKPSKEQFLTTVPVVLLCNDQIFSSADAFAKAVIDHQLGKVVSNIVPLSGHGLPAPIALPSEKYAVTYGFYEIRGTDYSNLEGVILKPDIVSKQKLQDLYKGIDTQLEAAKDYIKVQIKTSTQ